MLASTSAACALPPRTRRLRHPVSLQQCTPVTALLPAQRRSLRCCAQSNTSYDFSKLANKAYLDDAARRFTAGLEAGFNAEQLAAMEMGAESVEALTELQAQYVGKIKEKLIKRAEELKQEEKERRMREARNFELGKYEYGRGEYPKAVELLERAVEDLGANSPLGGEAQLWLALAYQACGRESDCIELYKFIETNHPSRKIQRQAGELRYILEAPKLEIGEDERVKIPLIESDGWRKTGRTSYKPKSMIQKDSKVEKTYWDAASWDIQPPPFTKDKWYVWALAAGWLAMCAWALTQT